MTTKTTTITAQSVIGWAVYGNDEPHHQGTISEIESPPPDPVQWFVRDDKYRWRKVTGTYQINPWTSLPGKGNYDRSPAGIQDDMVSFLIDFAIAIEYYVPERGKYKRTPNPNKRKTTSIRLSPEAKKGLEAIGGASDVAEKVGLAIASGESVTVTRDGLVVERGEGDDS